MLDPEPGGEILRLILSGSSQRCALIEAGSPCQMQALGRAIDWRMCPRVLRIRTAAEPGSEAARPLPEWLRPPERMREPGED